MALPKDIKKQEQKEQKELLTSFVVSLSKCPGWKNWFGPKVFKAHDEAEAAILAAIAKGETAPSGAVATYQGLHGLVTDFRTTEKSIGTPPPSS